MNFAYIDPMAIFESGLGTPLGPPPKLPIIAVPCELDQEWKDFEETLGNFKTKYAQTRVDQGRTMAELSEKLEEVSYLEMMLETVRSPGLKERIESMVEDYQNEAKIGELKTRVGEMAGRVEAMKAVLAGTNAERYAKFTCFVCMDRLVDLFIEPCGHVICEPCWSHTRDHSRCPGCRARCEGAKKIFTMN